MIPGRIVRPAGRADIPFTVEQFFDVFALYNTSVWPAHLIAYALGILAVLMARRGSERQSRAVSAVLAAFWIWTGIVYHMMHFRAINKAAVIFGAMFILEGVMLFLTGCLNARLGFRFTKSLNGVAGSIFILYAMVLYPLVGMLSGHIYPRCPMFGVAPCPLAIFTFGVLLLASPPVPIHLVVIPFLWSLVGLSAAIGLQVPQDYGLGLAGVAGLILVLVGNRRFGRTRTHASAPAN